jgi:hypothetical protein
MVTPAMALANSNSRDGGFALMRIAEQFGKDIGVYEDLFRNLRRTTSARLHGIPPPDHFIRFLKNG